MILIEDITTNFHTYLLTEKRVSKNTFMAYKRDIDQFMKFLESEKLTLDDLTHNRLKDFLKYIKQEGVGAKTMSRKISSLKLFFNFLSDRYKLPNLAGSLVFPKIDKKLPSYLSEQEIQRLLEACGEDESDKGIRNKVMLYLLYASGMRVSELIELTTDQIRFDTGFINVTGKGNKERIIPIPKNILVQLRAYLDVIYSRLVPQRLLKSKKMPLFGVVYDDKVKPLSRQSLWGIMKKLLLKAGITKNISPHSLRHSLATHLLSNGADLRSLQMLLGHENLATLQVYTHLGKKKLRDDYDKKHPRA